ncbi:unnamed protein product [Oppiella nova]|uniref:Uncharacterized protein n=1 Tax=Oppiella nova TaxID=334625 RepID=A0A7R9MNM2_9ACAR|nr:unnamed protein product [Oppiella nova]CAG2180358.1 unnamed protein product [Oppiella nova]
MPDWLSADAKDLIRSMLKINPSERITIEKILTHRWLRDEMIGSNTCVQVMKANLDEEVFFQCHRLFPEVPLKELRQNILHGFGYQTACYWLLKMNANTVQPLPLNVVNSPLTLNKPTVQRRRSKSVDDTINNENNIRPKLKRKFIDTVNSPMPNLPKRLMLDVKTSSPGKSPNTRVPVLVSHSPKLTPNAKDERKLKEIKSPVNSPVIANRKARLFHGLNDSFKSPLLNPSASNDWTKTAFNAPIECTPKKSLLKRFLETATPAKSHTPRAITTSTTMKNITLTKFTEPNKCIDKLIETLTAKGIQCKQKE